NVPSVSYLLGLADVVGELRRRALDSIRRGDIEIAAGSLENMELIYDEFILMYESMRVVSELRRKLDIARRIIEATRGDVAIEIRRDSLERSIEKLERALRVKKE
ncbi:haloacid dehalogenase, partial [Candidatus Bathyarchaeota archaeon]|nr:haloacid dehalogenase [Candidatus Bathyarchaeota archaeon]